MVKHAELSPSSAKRWMLCPGSVALSRGVVPPSSIFADEGTAAHFLASICLLEGSNASRHLGRVIFLFNDGSEGFADELDEPPRAAFDVDADMVEYVQLYLDYVRDVQKATGGELFVEQRVPISHITGEEGAEGTSDAIIATPDEIIVIDLKYGRGVEVDAKENYQAMLYVSGARRVLQLAGVEVDNFRVAIVQPRITRQPSEWSFTAKDLDAFEREVEATARIAMDMANGLVDVECTPSEEACKFCPAKSRCGALDKYVQQVIGADFEAVVDCEKQCLLGGLEPAPLALKMQAVDLIEDWCKAVRAEVERRLVAGIEVPGFKLVQGRAGVRKWVDEGAVEELLKKMRVKTALMYHKKLISPTDAEKLFKGSKKWEHLQEFISRKEGAPSVAPEKDKRPAISVAPNADDFNVVA